MTLVRIKHFLKNSDHINYSNYHVTTWLITSIFVFSRHGNYIVVSEPPNLRGMYSVATKGKDGKSGMAICNGETMRLAVMYPIPVRHIPAKTTLYR